MSDTLGRTYLEKTATCTDCGQEYTYTHKKGLRCLTCRENVTGRIIEKICVICDTTKNVSEFNPNKRSSDGYYNYCKECGYTKRNTIDRRIERLRRNCEGAMLHF